MYNLCLERRSIKNLFVRLNTSKNPVKVLLMNCSDADLVDIWEKSACFVAFWRPLCLVVVMPLLEHKLLGWGLTCASEQSIITQKPIIIGHHNRHHTFLGGIIILKIEHHIFWHWASYFLELSIIFQCFFSARHLGFAQVPNFEPKFGFWELGLKPKLGFSNLGSAQARPNFRLSNLGSLKTSFKQLKIVVFALLETNYATQCDWLRCAAW